MTDLELDPAQLDDTPWHALSSADALSKLRSSDTGLSAGEADERHSRFGPNKLPGERAPGIVRIFLRQFRDPLIYVLLIAGLVSLALDNLANAAFILAVLAINSIIGTLQEGRAERSAAALQEMIRVRARVRRDGQRQSIDATDLVPGDLVLLEAGNAVPADLRLVASEDLEVDEAPLTGESVPVSKDAGDELDEEALVTDRSNMAFAGSTATSGSATGVVCGVGKHTQVGQIAESLASGEAQAPPLVLKLRRFTRQVALFVLLAVILLSVTQALQGVAVEQLFFLGVALAVSAIPAGLPIAITVAMAMATRRMAERNVIVRQLPAVEGLGSCTLIASDKTGTLTQNTLTVRRLQLAGGDEFDVTGEGYDPDGAINGESGSPEGEGREAVEALARAGILCNDAEIEFGDEGVETDGDSVDLAFLVLGAKLDMDRDEMLGRHPQVDSIPFSAQTRYAVAFNRVGEKIVAHVKGAAEAVLPQCADVDVDALRERENELAREGFRVLAVAAGEVAGGGDEYGDDDLEGLEFLGFAALIDPVRAEVPEAVERCRSAGAQIRMITGDHPATGAAIARELGIAGEDVEAVTGSELHELGDDEEAVAEKIRGAAVFARVEPTQKTQIVESLQRQGELVAVTGDGVNDAPALKAAHIGVAMGQGGTDVARRAASLILSDDNFASLVNGIEQGRGAYDNVRKVTWLLLATATGEVLLFFLALFAGLPLPLTAIQLLWLNLVTNGIQDVALALEKTEPDVLERKPRPPDEPIFNRRMIQETLISGLYMGGVAFVLYYVLLERFGMDEFQARNLVLLLMVLFENMHTFSCRSETRSLFRVPLSANRLLIFAVIAAHGVHIAAMYTPGLRDVLDVEPVAPGIWGSLLAVAVSLLVLDEVAKAVHRRAAENRDGAADRDPGRAPA